MGYRNGTRCEIGSRFGRLVVERIYHHVDGRRLLVDAICDCGNRAIGVARSNLGRGSLSCGCLQIERAKKASLIHGLTESPEHLSWMSAHGRCYNIDNEAYESYGGRGITMSEEWRDSFIAFLRDMGQRPPGTSLERRDNDGPYSKDNCYWATRKQQANNRRSSRHLEWNGETLTMAEWADRIGMPYARLIQRIHKLRWSIERAMTEPLDPRFK